MNYLEIILYLINNPKFLLFVAGKFFDKIHGSSLYEDEEYIIG
jgi:hypothetical protein